MSEGLVASLAGVRPLSAVQPKVLGQVMLVLEGLVAGVAGERSDTCRKVGMRCCRSVDELIDHYVRAC